MELERAAADRFAVQGRDQEQARGRGHLVVGGRDAPGRVEAAVEAPGQLLDVGPQAVPRVGVPRIAPADLYRRGGQQSLHLGHRGDERPRCRSVSGPSSEAAAASERRSSSARSAPPAAVSRAVLSLPSASFASTVTSPSCSSDRSSLLR